MFDKEHFKVSGKVRKNRFVTDYDVLLHNNSKQVFINNTKINKISEYLGNVNIIIWTPDDLDIVKGSPSIRRDLMNIQLSQLYPQYLKLLNEYNKILKTRNEYLKLITEKNLDTTYLDILTTKLIERSISIYKYRYEYIFDINSRINDIFNDIYGKSKLEIETNWEYSYDEIISQEIISIMKDKYKSYEKREILYKTTLIGPHRDDIIFNLNDNDLKKFGSQGQQRLSIICFKLAEIELFYKVKNTYPILLLDDILSEIDKEKKNKLLNYLNKDIQTIITTTDLHDINKKFRDNAQIFNIKNGLVIKKGE